MTVHKSNTITISITPSIEHRARMLAGMLNMSLSKYVVEAIFYHNEHVSGESVSLPLFEGVGLTGSWDDGTPEGDKMRYDIATGKDHYKKICGKKEVKG